MIPVTDKEGKIILEIYRKLYKKAEPSVDFDAIWRLAEDKPFYMYFYLPQEKQDKIIEKVLDNYPLSSRERDRIRYSVILGAAPSSVKNEYKDNE